MAFSWPDLLFMDPILFHTLQAPVVIFLSSTHEISKDSISLIFHSQTNSITIFLILESPLKFSHYSASSWHLTFSSEWELNYILVAILVSGRIWILKWLCAAKFLFPHNSLEDWVKKPPPLSLWRISSSATSFGGKFPFSLRRHKYQVIINLQTS